MQSLSSHSSVILVVGKFVCAILFLTGIARAEPRMPLGAPVGDADEPMALTEMARRYENAEGVPRDYEHAVQLYCVAAKLGFADAQYALGWMYANGRGVARDDEIAAQLFQAAAEQGHMQAATMSRYVAPEKLSLPPCMTEPEQIAVQQEQVPTVSNFPKGQVTQLVEKLAPHYRIDPKLVLAIISVESGFNVHAISPKNAQGLMQLMPETAQRFRVKNAFDAEENLKGGIAYLQWLLAYFRGDVALVSAAYNAGEKAVDKYRGVPPYLETLDYVKRVGLLYRKHSHPFQRGIAEASAVTMR